MTSFNFGRLVALVIILVSTCCHSSSNGDQSLRLTGSVVDCDASVEEVNQFNNDLLFPLLRRILQQNYFRYYKVNMNKPCPLWKDQGECTNRECGVPNCDDEVPAGLRRRAVKIDNVSASAEQQFNDAAAGTCSRTDNNDEENHHNTGNKLDPLDSHISSLQKEHFERWAVHDDSQDNKFCDVDDEDSTDMHYVDLERNPERYTGYKGDSATQVWKAIYEENCFKPDPKFDKQFLLQPILTAGLCLEKRAFYRLISGLHTSITVSIAAHNFKPAATPAFGNKGHWVRNVDMYRSRFCNPKDVKGDGKERLKNLYFVYLLELRALQKLAPYLRSEKYYTGIEADDLETERLTNQLLNLVESFPKHFDESAMFRSRGNVEALARTLKEEFRRHFVNISSIMDCVGCDKCRLWGKLQTHGIGTALKILFASPDRRLPPSTSPVDVVDFHKRLRLQRNDIVALLNSLGRFASSIKEVALFEQADDCQGIIKNEL